MACPQFATLSNGAKMPLVGLGTWLSKGDDVEKAVHYALQAGYRHIDTAHRYGNEDVVGKVINSWVTGGKLKREDLFIVTKMPPVGMRPQSVPKYLTDSLRKLQTNYVDLYLLHWPMGIHERGDEVLPVGKDGKVLFDYSTDHLAVWKAMEAEVDAGRAKAIGLSNYNERQIQRILDNCRIPPANLQIELHVDFQQRPLVDFCFKNGISVTAYSSLGSPGSINFMKAAGKEVKLPDLLGDATVVDIAQKHKKSPAQILLKHLIQKGIIVIPKSVTEQRVKENIQLFDFELRPDDITKLDALDLGKDGRFFSYDWEGAKQHPEYPY